MLHLEEGMREGENGEEYYEESKFTPGFGKAEHFSLDKEPAQRCLQG